MKSLEARLADRERRQAEAEKQREETGNILTDAANNSAGFVAGQEESERTTEEGEEGEEEESLYADYTVEQLKAELDERRIEHKSGLKKAELIKLIEDDDAA